MVHTENVSCWWSPSSEAGLGGAIPPVFATKIYRPSCMEQSPYFVKVSVMFKSITGFMVCRLKSAHIVCIILGEPLGNIDINIFNTQV